MERKERDVVVRKERKGCGSWKGRKGCGSRRWRDVVVGKEGMS